MQYREMFSGHYEAGAQTELVWPPCIGVDQFTAIIPGTSARDGRLRMGHQFVDGRDSDLRASNAVTLTTLDEPHL